VLEFLFAQRRAAKIGMASPQPMASFEAIALPHLGAAYNLARWLMRNADDAEDVVQEAMLRALTYFDGFRGTNFHGWLLQIVRNTAYSSLRLNRGVRIVSLDAAPGGTDETEAAIPELPDPGDDPETALLHERDRQLLDRLLERLPVELREVVVLRELQELSYKEIAQITEAPIGTVMSRLWRGRRLLTAAAGASSAAEKTA